MDSTNKGWKSRVLTIDNPEWDRYVLKTEECDVFHVNNYMKLFQETFNERAALFIFGNEEEYLAYPHFFRDITRLPFGSSLRENKRRYYDIISPWYYGGILYFGLASANRPELYRRYYESFSSYCRENGIITEFGRLHPFSDAHEYVKPYLNIKRTGRVVYIDLTQSEEQIWNGMERSNRKRIRKGQEQGVSVIEGSTISDIDTFIGLYHGLMDRKGARDFYYFDLAFFKRLIELFPHQYRLLLAVYKKQVIGGLFLLGGKNCVHTYLSASDPRYLYLSPNNILKYAGALLGKKEGYRTYILGGGNSDVDALFKFKRSFSPTVKDFNIYYRVYDTNVYNDLIILLKQYYKSLGIDKNYDNFFFPEYRR
jgi:hypothetical protein